MNRKEVIFTIHSIHDNFSRALAHLVAPDYAAGYKQALNDMAKMFENAPLFEDFEEERKELHSIIKSNSAQITKLKKTVEKQERTIDKLMLHVDIWSLLDNETCAESGR